MRKQLTIMGEIWDFWPVLGSFDSVFDSRYISYYKPWLKGDIDRKRIIINNEKNKLKLLWPYKFFSRTLLIKKAVDDFKPEFIVTHHDDSNISVIPYMLLSKYILRKDTKFVAFIHAGTETYRTKGLFIGFMNFMIRSFYKRFDTVVTVSEKNKRDLQEMFGLKNVKIIYNPVDVKEAQRLARKKNPVVSDLKRKGKFVFLSIGRLTEQKGQWYLLRAFKHVADVKKNVALVIIGTGELKEQLEKLANDLGIGDKVFFVGKQDNVYSLINDSDCFVLSTLWESFGQVLVESLCLDKTIICTDCEAGPREIIAPEIGLNTKIKYPYFGKYGILTKPFKREYVFKTLKEKALCPEEKMLSDLMLSAYEKKLKHYKNGKQRAKDFDIGVIKKQLRHDLP